MTASPCSGEHEEELLQLVGGDAVFRGCTLRIGQTLPQRRGHDGEAGAVQRAGDGSQLRPRRRDRGFPSSTAAMTASSWPRARRRRLAILRCAAPSCAVAASDADTFVVTARTRGRGSRRRLPARGRGSAGMPARSSSPGRRAGRSRPTSSCRRFGRSLLSHMGVLLFVVRRSCQGGEESARLRRVCGRRRARHPPARRARRAASACRRRGDAESKPAWASTRCAIAERTPDWHMTRTGPPGGSLPHLVEPAAQRGVRYGEHAGKVPGGQFCGCTHVEDQRGLGDGIEVLRVPEPQGAGADVLADHPTMLTGSFADPYGGAYARSRSISSSTAQPARMAVASTSILLSTPSAPTACAPSSRPSLRRMWTTRWICEAPGKVAGVLARMKVQRVRVDPGCDERGAVRAGHRHRLRTDTDVAVPTGRGSGRACSGRRIASATSRPARLAGPASATGRTAPVTASTDAVASPTA